MESDFMANIDLDSDSISNWERINHIGSGRFEFFKVRLFGARHFVKQPTSRYAQDLQTIESLRKEFNIGYNLSHPYIVKYLRMESGAVFQEYVDGLSIQQMIDSQDIRLKSPQFLEHICRQLLEAASYIHSHGVVHNDIKSDNVMITRIGNQVKLIDFGGAYTDSWDATQGYTPAYKAPEQEYGRSNVYTDIFQIGKLMEELAPLAGASRGWRSFIKKATASDINARFSSDHEAISAISKYNHLSKIGIAVAIAMAIGCVVALSLHTLRIKSSPVISSDTAKADTINKIIHAESEEIVTLPILNPNASISDYEKQQSVFETIDTKLEKFIIDKYNKEVFTECQKYEEMTNAEERSKQDLYIHQSVMPKVIDDTMLYVETLAETYPEQAEHIRIKATDLLNDQQTLAALRLEKAFKKFNGYDENINLD